MHNRGETISGLMLSQKLGDIVSDIAHKIQTGALPPGTRLPSTRQMTRQYGVSLVTAHRAAQELVKMGLLERKNRSGTYVCPTRRTPSSSPVAGLLFTYSNEHIWGKVTNTLVTGLHDAGIMTVTLSEAQVRKFSANSDARDPIAELVKRQPLAMVLKSMLPVQRLLPFVKPGTLWLSMAPEFYSGLPIETLGPDVARGMFLAVQYLYGAGHRRIQLCALRKNPGEGLKTFEKSVVGEAYEVAMREHGIKPEKYFLPLSETPEFPVAMDALLGEMNRPTALLCMTDFDAIQIYRYLEKSGLRVPDDMAVFGAFNTPWAETFKLTSLDYRYQDIARASIRRIVEYMNNPDLSENAAQRLLFTPRIIVRESA